jgi:hypothetical protein
MPGQTFTLAEYPFDMVELACEKCGRHGKLRKTRLIQQHGPEMGVAHLRELLIEDCPKFRKWHDPCGAYYVGLPEWWKKQRLTEGRAAQAAAQLAASHARRLGFVSLNCLRAALIDCIAEVA